jgi:hypothetical protein
MPAGGSRGRLATLIGICVLASASLGAVPVAAKSNAVAASVRHTVVLFPGSATAVEGIACPSATTCDVVGDSKAGGAVVPITSGVPGQPEAIAGADLQAIACASGTCEMVGQNSAQLGVVAQLVNGTPGQVFTVGPKIYVLGAVTCLSATTCEAVGTDQGAVVQTADGTPGTALGAAGVGIFSGIACPTSTSCEAVGLSPSEQGLFVPIALADGVPVPAQPEPESGAIDLASIACASPTWCEAVGGFGPSHAHEGVVESITNGVPGTAHVVRGVSYVSGIACPTTTTCEAVGIRDATRHKAAKGLLVPIVNGSPGAAQALPQVFTTLACPSATTCDAIGNLTRKPYRGFVAVLHVNA